MPAKRSRGKGLFTALALALSISVPAASAEDGSERILGDLGGFRPTLAERGLTVENFVTLDYGVNARGGAQAGDAFLGANDFVIGLDTEKAGLWNGGTFALDLLWSFGQSQSELVGDLQGVDNFEAPDNLTVYQATFEQQLWNPETTLLFGLHEFNSDFYFLNYSSVLINSSFGFGPEVSAAGVSTYPTTALALRLKTEFDGYYGLLGVYDGVPGSQTQTRGTFVQLRDSEGVFVVGEAGFRTDPEQGERYRKWGVGAWHRSTDYEDFRGYRRDDNQGLYIIGEESLTREEDPAQGLGAFLQLGFAPDERNELEYYVGAGLVYTGLFCGRDADSTALGAAWAGISDDLREENSDLARGETAIELSHRFEVADYLAVQPDVQYILDPGAEKALDNALFFMLRVQLAL